MKKVLKAFTQNIYKGLGYFTLVVAAATIIWKAAISYDKVSTNLETIIEAQFVQGEQLDSIEDTLYFVNKSVRELDASHNALRRSYIQYIAKDSTLKTSEFLNYMQGLELDLKKKLIEQDSILYRKRLDSVLQNLKIVVRKIDNNHGNKGQY